MSKPILDHWQFGTFFGLPAIQGVHRYTGRLITRPWHYTSSGIVGLYGLDKKAEPWQLGIPHVTEPTWLSRAAWKKWFQHRYG